jgi:hypothetical protein
MANTAVLVVSLIVGGAWHRWGRGFRNGISRPSLAQADRRSRVRIWVSCWWIRSPLASALVSIVFTAGRMPAALVCAVARRSVRNPRLHGREVDPSDEMLDVRR